MALEDNIQRKTQKQIRKNKRGQRDTQHFEISLFRHRVLNICFDNHLKIQIQIKYTNFVGRILLEMCRFPKKGG